MQRGDHAKICGKFLGHRPWFADDQKIYTEDDIPIRVVHISNLPKCTKKAILYDVFGTYGKIISCYIKFKYVNVPHYAFVTFSDPECAQRVQMESITLENHKLCVSPADSWHQPRTPYEKYFPKEKARFGTKSKNSRAKSWSKTAASKSTVDETEYDDQYNILNMLNHDCITHIFSYLSLKDLIRSERVNKRWASIVRNNLQSVRTFKTSSYLSELFTTNMLRSVLIKIGSYLKILHIDNKWSVLNDRTSQLIGKYCHNLTELLVTGITASNWRNILSNCKQLRSLVLLSCGNLTDDNFKALRSELRELTITCNNKLSGQFLHHLTKCKLEKLVLTNCKNLISKQVIAGLKNLNHLTYLGLSHCPISVFREINTILKIVPNLTEFSSKDILYPGILSMDAVADLKELTYLNLSRNKMISDEFLQLISVGCPKLTYLNICNCGSYLQLFPPSLSVVSKEGFNHIWKLKELSVLIVSSTGIGEKALKSLGVNGGGAKLTKFISRHNVEISNSAVIKLVEKCPDLKIIDIYGCAYFDQSVVWGVDKALMQHPHRTSTLEINIAPNKHFSSIEWQSAAKQVNSKLLVLRIDDDYSDPLPDRSMESLKEYYEFEGLEDDQFDSDYENDSIDDEDYEYSLDDMEFIGGGDFFI